MCVYIISTPRKAFPRSCLQAYIANSLTANIQDPARKHEVIAAVYRSRVERDRSCELNKFANAIMG